MRAFKENVRVKEELTNYLSLFLFRSLSRSLSLLPRSCVNIEMSILVIAISKIFQHPHPSL